VARERPSLTRWDEDNRLALNPWAFVAVGVGLAAIAGLFVLFAIL